MKINHWPNEAREAYEELEYKLAEMTADRDSWKNQADERVKDCEMFINQLADKVAEIARLRAAFTKWASSEDDYKNDVEL